MTIDKDKGKKMTKKDIQKKGKAKREWFAGLGKEIQKNIQEIKLPKRAK